MAKKASADKKEARPSIFSGKMGKVYARIFDAVKLITGVCLLPLVYSSVVAMMAQLELINHEVRRSLWGGTIAFLVIFLFIWEGEAVYTKGHRPMETLFGFFQPLVKFAPFLVPVYAIIVTLLFGIGSLFVKEPWMQYLFIFLFGFFIALHLVFSSRAIRGKGKNFLSPDYVFIFSVVYIMNIWFTAFMLNFLSPEFRLLGFAQQALDQAGQIFYAVFKQLFIIR